MTPTREASPRAKRYTPGPWDYDMDFIVAPDPNGRHLDIYIAEIAHSDEEGRIASPEQQDANRHLIAAAPVLLEALHYLLEQTVDMDLNHGIELTEGERHARARALAAIAKADVQIAPDLATTIVIEVRGGVVQDVLNVPPGIEYVIRDYDNPEETDPEGLQQADEGGFPAD